MKDQLLGNAALGNKRGKGNSACEQALARLRIILWGANEPLLSRKWPQSKVEGSRRGW